MLAAVDTHVAKHIIKHCLLDLLSSSTRIIITENRMLTYHANQVLHIDGGTVRPSEVTPDDYDDDGYDCEIESHDYIKVNDVADPDRKSLDSVMLEVIKKLNIIFTVLPTTNLKQETKEYGTLSSHVLTSYWRSTGGFMGFMVLLSVFLMQLTRNLSDAWLAHWVSSNTTQKTTDSTEFYLKIYTSIAVINSAITLARAFLFAYAGIKAAKFIHNKLLTCVFYVSKNGRFLAIFYGNLCSILDKISFFRYHSTRTST